MRAGAAGSTAVSADAPRSPRSRLEQFVLERYPFAMAAVRRAAARVRLGEVPGKDAAAIERGRERFAEALRAELATAIDVQDVADPTPGISPGQRASGAAEELVDACDGFLAPRGDRASLADDERVEILRGMILTRATDNRLKPFFTGGEVRCESGRLPGQGLPLARPGGRSTPRRLRLRRGPAWRGADGAWQGDVVAPVIRDLGVALAMRPDPEAVRVVLAAQMGKARPADATARTCTSATSRGACCPPPRRSPSAR